MNVSGTRTVFVGVALFLALTTAGYFVWSAQRKAADASFFPQALKEARVNTAVTIASKRYVVSEGSVRLQDGSPASEDATQNALRLAYAQTLAIRNPLYGLSGTDPKRLESEIQTLVSAQEALADAQTTAEDAHVIRESLYPIRFLKSLAELERARQTFIASGTDSDEEVYRRALTQTVTAYAHDLAGFEPAFRTYASTTELLNGFTSTLPVKNIFQEFKNAHGSVEKIGKLAQSRASCLNGRSRSCDKADLHIQLPTEPRATVKPDVRALARADEILSAYAEAGYPHTSGWKTVGLSTSDCLLSFPSPYLFSIVEPEKAELPLTPFLYLGDIYATKNATWKEMTFRAHGIDMPSDYMNPIAYYRCPDMGNDISRATATILTARFASGHPDVASEERSELLTPPIYEDAAVRYIRAALPRLEKSEGNERNELIDLSLMFVNSSAGLDVLLHEISAVTKKNIEQAGAAQIAPQSAKFLFLSGSAFASVFQMYNPSAGGHRLTLYGAISSEEMQRKLRRFFSDSQLSRSQIVQSIRVHMLYESGAYNNLLKPKQTE